MKVLASRQENYKTVYICEIRHDELEKFLNLYYDKLKQLKDGEEFDLGKGYNFMQDTVAALKKTEDFIKSNANIINTITTGICVMANLAESGKE